MGEKIEVFETEDGYVLVEKKKTDAILRKLLKPRPEVEKR